MEKREMFLYISLVLKTIISFVLAYNIIANHEGGKIVDALGNFLVSGNYYLGFIHLGIISLINIIVVIGLQIPLKQGLAKRLNIQSLLLDIVLLLVVFYYGMQLWIGSHSMDYLDAISKMVESLSGMALFIYSVNFVTIVPYSIISIKKG